MKSIEKIIKERRTVHHYLPEKISNELVMETLMNSLSAPNHKLTFPARFYLIGTKSRNELVNISIKIRKERGSIVTEEGKEEIKERFLNPSHLLPLPKKFLQTQPKARKTTQLFHASFTIFPYSFGPMASVQNGAPVKLSEGRKPMTYLKLIQRKRLWKV